MVVFMLICKSDLSGNVLPDLEMLTCAKVSDQSTVEY